MAQVHQLLDGGDVLVIVIGRVVAQHVHVEAPALLNHRQSDASGANDGDGLACDLVAKEGEKRVPRWPLLLPHQALALPHLTSEHAHHEKCEFGCGFGEHVGCVRERNLVFVGVGPVDVVEADGDLRHDFERALPGFEDLSIDGIAQRRDQRVDAALHFLDDQLLRRRFWAREDRELVAALAQTVFGWISDAGRGKHTETFLVGHDIL